MSTTIAKPFSPTYLTDKYGSKMHHRRTEMMYSAFYYNIMPEKFTPWNGDKSKEYYWETVDENCILYMSKRMCDHYIAFLYGSRDPYTSWPKANPDNFEQVLN